MPVHSGLPHTHAARSGRTLTPTPPRAARTLAGPAPPWAPFTRSLPDRTPVFLKRLPSAPRPRPGPTLAAGSLLALSARPDLGSDTRSPCGPPPTFVVRPAPTFVVRPAPTFVVRRRPDFSFMRSLPGRDPVLLRACRPAAHPRGRVAGCPVVQRVADLLGVTSKG
ncbi:hypothetical protein EV646_12175 [Kribbella antiqua]|uniref:Uncharacterized protein n=1 Tax=Kribbella antiqua TaxID=2512217 RepID=A0A4R2I2I7_9ACTN|nr:hypothetical protein EV646_12175 [Kribbella antiqua]